MNQMRRNLLKGGIVGCGRVAIVSHIPVLQALKDVEIVAVCDQDETTAIETIRRFGIASAYGALSHMLKSEELDFVDICSRIGVAHKFQSCLSI